MAVCESLRIPRVRLSSDPKFRSSLSLQTKRLHRLTIPVLWQIPSFGERYLSTALFANLWEEASAQKAEALE